MPRPTDARKTEHIGIPVDLTFKDRLVRVARNKGRRHTDVARDYLKVGVRRDERKTERKAATA